MKIIFMGSGSFGIPSFESLVGSKHKIVAVVTTPPRFSGRGLHYTPSELARFINSKQISIPVLMPENLKSAEFIKQLSDLMADIYVVVSFRILPVEVFKIPTHGAINIHASLLPRYRGPAPVQRAIEAAETITGVTIFRINEKIDCGEIIVQRSTPIESDETSTNLLKRLSIIAADALLEALALIEQGNIEFKKQDTSLATYAPKLRKEEGKIDWNLSSEVIYNKIRAFQEFPGTYTFLNGERLNIQGGRVIYNDSSQAPGTICQITKEGFVVQCGKGQLLITQLKPEGKRNMDAISFLNGRHLKLGARFS